MESMESRQAVSVEAQQFHNRGVVSPIDPKTITREYNNRALECLVFPQECRCGVIIRFAKERKMKLTMYNYLRWAFGQLPTELLRVLERPDAKLLSVICSNNEKWYTNEGHDNMRSHTIISVTVGKRSLHSPYRERKLNSNNSTETEVLKANDGMNQMVWTEYFLQGQNYKAEYTTTMQDDYETSGVKINITFEAMKIDNSMKNNVKKDDVGNVEADNDDFNQV